MGQRNGCPAPGVSRPLSINEAIAMGLKCHRGHVVYSDAGGAVSVIRVYESDRKVVVAPPSSAQVAELRAHWAKPLVNPIHSPSGIKREAVPPQHPLQTVISRAPSRTGLAVVEQLACGHELRLKRSKAPMRIQRRCAKCPLQEAR